MPAISTFYGIVITMYWSDNDRHKLPHIHARYQGEKAVFSILDCEILAGNLSPSQNRMVQVWIDIHRDELLVNWELASNNKPIFRIEPLR